MGFWNTNDREDSKPAWLTQGQKRFCVRTNRGWELPVSGSTSNLAGQFEGVKTLSATTIVPLTEVLVALPVDPAVGGATASNFANRFVSPLVGATASGDTPPNYAPYISCPATGDGPTFGGPNSLGLSHDYSSNYGVNAYGVSTHLFGLANLGLTGAAGGTAYVKVQANDVNYTQTLTLSLTAAGMSSGIDARGILFHTGTTNLLDTTKVPLAVYEAFFGPTSTYNNDIGVIVLPKALTSGVYGMTATVNDGSTGYGSSGGATGFSRFFIQVR
jgi:hypothetical protein